ncbi:MAG: hypothetical protein A3F12_00525 [Gammaproteobacteria bacterium RIFCSPHIGHO2_12_FULL_38_14]|nr:MAG: hypothetical protein A3F12_00525 [Gammaproteobacteria bacterium RIFCSPHIGHO2_12_FULL_38_14]
MNILVIGYGSIGKRHAALLEKMGHPIALVTQQITNDHLRYSSINQAIANRKFDYIVIANATSLHFDTLNELVNNQFEGKIMVEKPLFSEPVENLIKIKSSIYVGYNLRFHSVIQRLKKLLSDEKLISFSARVGQYLPEWRKNIDYTDTYSAQKELGGGVLRDLSHELDYSTWICGPAAQVTALGGRFSDLHINSEDSYSIVMQCRHCPMVLFHMDYLSRIPRRELHIQTAKHTYFADLIYNVLQIDEKKEVLPAVDTYEAEHIAILNSHVETLCDYEQGLNIVKLIKIIENANQEKKWITV